MNLERADALEFILEEGIAGVRGTNGRASDLGWGHAIE